VWKDERRARKPWIIHEMISQMDGQRKRKNVSIVERRKRYKSLKAKKEYLDSICDEIRNLKEEDVMISCT
jgi:hypothetical protein